MPPKPPPPSAGPRKKRSHITTPGRPLASGGRKDEDDSLLSFCQHLGKQVPGGKKSLCVTLKYDPCRITLTSPEDENHPSASRSLSDDLDSISSAAMLGHLPSMSTEILTALKRKIDSLLGERLAEAVAADETEGWDVLADDRDLIESEIQYDFVEDVGIVKQYEK